MDEKVLSNVDTRLNTLERRSANLRIGLVTAISPLSVRMGMPDGATDVDTYTFTDVKAVNGLTPDVGDRVACMVARHIVLILGALDPASPLGDGATGPTGPSGPTGPTGTPGALEVYEQPGSPGSANVGAIWIDTDDTLTPAGSGLVPTGVIHQFAGPTAPTGYALCEGQSVLRAGGSPDYSALFAVIGTTYGSADGTHFNLPNLKGNVPVGRNSGDVQFDVLGETGGAKTHPLTIAELATHTHVQNTHTHKVAYKDGTAIGIYRTNPVINNPGGSDGAMVYGDNGNNMGTYAVAGVNQNTGSGSGHNNLQPYVVVNYIIKL